MSGRVGDAPPLIDAGEPPQEDGRQAFAEMFDAHAAHIFDYCFGILADRERAAGATQATLIAAHSLAGRLTDRSRQRAWLLALARHECRDSPSQHAVRTSAPGSQELTRALAFVDSADDDVTDAPTSQFSLRGFEEIAALRKMLETLPAGEREVLNLICRHEVSPAEVPAILGMGSASAGQLRTRAEASYAAALSRLDRERHAARRVSRTDRPDGVVDQTEDIAAWADQTGDMAAWADQTGDIAAWTAGANESESATDRASDPGPAADSTGNIAAWADQTGDMAAWADQTGDIAAWADQTGDIAAWADQTGDIAAWADQTGDIAMWALGTVGKAGDSSADENRHGLARLSALPLISLPPSIWRRAARAALDPRFQPYRDAVRAHADHLGADGFPVAADDPVLPSLRRLLGSSAVLAGLLLTPVALGAAGYAVFGPVAMDKVAHEYKDQLPSGRLVGPFVRPSPTASASSSPRASGHSSKARSAGRPTSSASAPSSSTSRKASHSTSPSAVPSISPSRSPSPSGSPSPTPTPTSPSPGSSSSSPSASAQASGSPATSGNPDATGSPAPTGSPAVASSPSPASSLEPSAS